MELPKVGGTKTAVQCPAFELLRGYCTPTPPKAHKGQVAGAEERGTEEKRGGSGGCGRRVREQRPAGLRPAQRAGQPAGLAGLGVRC